MVHLQARGVQVMGEAAARHGREGEPFIRHHGAHDLVHRVEALAAQDGGAAGLKAQFTGSSGTAVNPFSRVDFYRYTAANQYDYLGSSSAAPAATTTAGALALYTFNIGTYAAVSPTGVATTVAVAGDEIIAIDGDRSTEWQDQLLKIRNSEGRPLIFTIKRGGVIQEISAAPRMTDIDDGTSRYVLGIINEFGTKRLSPVSSVTRAAELTWRFTTTSATALVQLPTKIPALWGQTFGGQERDQNGLVGVVGVARVSGQAAASDELDLAQRLGTFILIVASLNIFVGLFNLLPILPLDGGHMAVAIADAIRAFLARLRGKPRPAAIDVQVLTPITATVFVILAALTILLLIADIFNPILLNF